MRDFSCNPVNSQTKQMEVSTLPPSNNVDTILQIFHKGIMLIVLFYCHQISDIPEILKWDLYGNCAAKSLHNKFIHIIPHLTWEEKNLQYVICKWLLPDYGVTCLGLCTPPLVLCQVICNLKYLLLPVDIPYFSTFRSSFALSVKTLCLHLLTFSPGNDLPVHYLRLLASPLQLLSAAVWHVVQHGLVDHYGMLEEFVTMVTELVPELMSYRQKAQLIMGLRARVSNNHDLCLFCLMF